MYLPETAIQVFLLMIITFTISAVSILSLLIAFPFIKADNQDLLHSALPSISSQNEMQTLRHAQYSIIPINVCGK